MNRLNLLPEDMKKEIAFAKRNAKLYQVLMNVVVIFFVLLIFVGLLGFYVYTREVLVKEEKDQAATELSSYKDVESEAKDFAERLNLIKKSENEKVDWNLILDEISKNVPKNLRLDSMDLPSDPTKRAKLTGYAANDSDISLLQSLLSKSKLFQFVDIESITSGSDPSAQGKIVRNFIITMNINLKEAKK